MMIRVGDVVIGGEGIPIQSMIKNPATEIDRTLTKIGRLSKMGCDIIRISIPDRASASALKEIAKASPIPVVADIHFDYRLAIAAIEAGAHKIRINPGNIGDEGRVRGIIHCLREYGIPVRIGINGGSLPDHVARRFSDPVTVMLESAKEEIRYFEKYGYEKIILSFKSSSVLETIEVNRRAREEFPFPLHIGVTEAGDAMDGTVKNTAGISFLLLNNIGDTIRVSLTAPEADEVKVARRILESTGKRDADFDLISCPTCGRCHNNIMGLIKEIQEGLAGISLKKKIRLAVMGCMVNGPGEAKNAHFGVACGRNRSVLFKGGEKLKVIRNDVIIDELMSLAREYSQ